MSEVYDAPVAESNGALVPADRGTAVGLLLEPVVNPGELVKHSEQVSRFIAEALVDGRDFMQIPGTNAKSLLQAGAERCMIAFGLAPEFEVVEAEKDHDREVAWTKPKPKMRPAKFDVTCADCGAKIREGDPQIAFKDADGKWINTCEECASAGGGGQEGFSLGLYRYVVKCRLVNRATGEMVGEGIASCSTLESKYIDRPRDCENTVLQMAEKRAMVRAVRTTLGLSDQFTQDIEERQDDRAGGRDELPRRRGGNGHGNGGQSSGGQRRRREQSEPEPKTERQLFGALTEAEQWRDQQDADPFERDFEWSLEKGAIRPNGARHFALYNRYAEACEAAKFDPWPKLKPTTPEPLPKPGGKQPQEAQPQEAL